MKTKNLKQNKIEREKILSAALRCFLKNGYAATSIDVILKEYGRSKGNIYYYFKNKEEIFIELVKMWQQETSEKILEVQEEYKTIIDFLPAFIEGFFRHLQQNHEHLRAQVEFFSISSHNEKIKDTLRELEKKRYKILEKYKSDFKSNNDYEIFVNWLFCMFAGIIMQSILNDKLVTVQFRNLIKQIAINTLDNFILKRQRKKK